MKPMSESPTKPILHSKTVLAWLVMVLTAIGAQVGVEFPDLGIPGAVGVALEWLSYISAMSIVLFRIISTQRLDKRIL